MHAPARLLVLLALLAAPLAAQANDLYDFLVGKHELEVITNTEMTPVGRQLPPPSKFAPQYYIAVKGGYRDFGSTFAGGAQPADKEVLKLLTAELAKRGYLPATPTSPDPTLVLILTWGTLNADYDTGNLDLPPRQRNRAQILRFLGGRKLGFDDAFFNPFTPQVAGVSLMPAGAQELYDASTESFYVVIVAALDLESVRQKKRVLLWTTRIASFSRGLAFSENLPGMVALGGAQFGRETGRPVWTNAGDRYKPDIRIGELQLVEYLNGAQVPVLDPFAAAKDKPAALRRNARPGR